jgi:ABC-type oligopeptide transport system ATPase subunit
MVNYVKLQIQKTLFLKPQHDYTKELLHLMPKIESIYN